MGVVAGLGAAAAAASLGSSISNMTSGGGGSGMPGIPSAAGLSLWDQGGINQDLLDQIQSIRQMPNYPQQNYPAYQGNVNDILNNPYQGQYQNLVNQASQYGVNTVAPWQQGAAQSLYGMTNQSLPAASQILQTGFDPQSALYNRTQQQVQDQVNAINSMYGLNNTPYGAGVANKALTDFNIDWQNQQLKRQSEAASAYGGLTSTIGRQFGGASDLGTQAIGTLQQAGAAPYTTANVFPQQNLQALDQLTQAGLNTYTVPMQLENIFGNYLGLGQVSDQIGLRAAQLGLQGQQQSFNQNQILGGQLGQSLSGLQQYAPQLQSGYNRLFGPGSGIDTAINGPLFNPSTADQGYTMAGGLLTPTNPYDPTAASYVGGGTDFALV